MRRKALVVMVILVALAASAAIVLAEKPEEERRVLFFSSGGSWLGVHLADVDADRARELGLKDVAGAEIRSVVPGSPAEKAALQKGDVILDYLGTPVVGVAQLTRLVRETPAGRTVRMKVYREGSTRTSEVTLAERGGDKEKHVEMFGSPGERHRIVIPHIEVPDIDFELPDLEGVHELMEFGGPRAGRLGIAIGNLTEQLGAFFGVEKGAGVLVRSVKEKSRADEAGVKAGDVIVRMDDQAIASPGDLHAALRERRGKAMSLTVVRDRRERTISIAAAKEDTSLLDSEGGEFSWVESEGGLFSRLDDATRERVRLALDAARAQREAADLHTGAMHEQRERALKEAGVARERARSLRLWAAAVPDDSI